MAAGTMIAAALQEIVADRGHVNVIFGSAPSQNETLATLSRKDLDWSKITAFHLDEYIGASEHVPYSFRRYLFDHLFRDHPPHRFYGIDGEAVSVQHECRRYAALLEEHLPDIALLGIGENGHLAFNDPPADFNDQLPVRLVHLADSCRRQQVQDRTFKRLEDVPLSALTLTIPTIMRVPRLFVVVPGSTKARAVHDTLMGAVSSSCPASILRTHHQAILFLDEDSACCVTQGE